MFGEVRLDLNLGAIFGCGFSKLEGVLWIISGGLHF